MVVRIPRDLLRLSDTELCQVVDRLAAEDDGDARKERRESQRFRYQAPRICLAVEHPGGGTSMFLATTRNVSSGGIAVLHGGFLHIGSPCKMTLTRRDGQREIHPATVARCRHVQGSVHDIGLRFEREIDPMAFVNFDDTSGDASPESVDPAALRGRVLYVEDLESDRRLLAHHLQATGIDLQLAGNADEAMASLGEQPPDILLVGLNLGGEDGVELVGRFRGDGFTGPIVSVSAETNQPRIDAAREAGAADHLAKPYSPRDLVTLLARLHQQIGAMFGDDALYSSLESQAGMTELVEAFIEEAHQLATRLQNAIDGDDLSAARELSLNVMGSAQSYGFARLSGCATDAIRALDATSSVAESAATLGKLQALCQSVAVRPKTEPPAAAAEPEPDPAPASEPEPAPDGQPADAA